MARKAARGRARVAGRRTPATEWAFRRAFSPRGRNVPGLAPPDNGTATTVGEWRPSGSHEGARFSGGDASPVPPWNMSGRGVCHDQERIDAARASGENARPPRESPMSGSGDARRLFLASGHRNRIVRDSLGSIAAHAAGGLPRECACQHAHRGERRRFQRSAARRSISARTWESRSFALRLIMLRPSQRGTLARGVTSSE